MRYELGHLDALESEAIHVMREVAAERERPILLFSGGKDSLVLLRLAEKAFRPARFPFPLLHVDTGHNVSEVIEFRGRRVPELGESLIVASVQAEIEAGNVPGVSDPYEPPDHAELTLRPAPLDVLVQSVLDALDDVEPARP